MNPYANPDCSSPPYIGPHRHILPNPNHLPIFLGLYGEPGGVGVNVSSLIGSSPAFRESVMIDEPRCEKTGLQGFRPDPTQTGLYIHRRWLEA